MKRVYIVIVNWNGWEDTIECLESVFGLEYPDFRVVVCDNGSTDGSIDNLVAWAEGVYTDDRIESHSIPKRLTSTPVPKPISFAVYSQYEAEAGGDLVTDTSLVLIRNNKNLGFAGGNNVGLKYIQARGGYDYVWLLNNDTVIAPDALTALVERMQVKFSAGMCGSTLVHYDQPDRIQARAGGWYCKWIGLAWHLGQLEKMSKTVRPDHAEKWMNYVVGAAMFVSRDFLEVAGLMDEGYFLYFEELDWLMKAQGNFTLAYAPSSIVYHKVGATIGTSTNLRNKSLICDYYNIRNRIRFTRKYYPALLPTIYLTLCIAIIRRLAYGQWNRALMIFKLMLSKGNDLERIGHY